jgi:hypothetical protein
MRRILWHNLLHAFSCGRILSASLCETIVLRTSVTEKRFSSKQKNVCYRKTDFYQLRSAKQGL